MVALHIVAVVHILRERHSSAVVRQRSVQSDAERRAVNERGRENKRRHAVPLHFCLAHHDAAAVFLVPGHFLTLTQLIVFPQLVNDPEWEIPAHAVRVDQPCAGEGGAVRDFLAVFCSDAQTEQPFARRRAPEVQQHRLDEQHQQHADRRINQRKQPVSVKPAAEVQAEDAPRYGVPEQTVNQ